MDTSYLYVCKKRLDAMRLVRKIGDEFVLMEKSCVNHPDHYQSCTIEAIDVIEKFELGFSLGNVIKYVLRSSRKGEYLNDLKKAAWYLNREIEQFEKWEKEYEEQYGPSDS